MDKSMSDQASNNFTIEIKFANRTTFKASRVTSNLNGASAYN